MSQALNVNQTSDSNRREMALRRAFLLFERKQLDAARRILAALPRDPDVADLLARIDAEQNREKNTLDRLRQWRYELHLDTTARRVWAYIVAFGVATYGGMDLMTSVPYAAQHGPMATITTRVNVGNRYRGPWVDYSRPVCIDLVYGVLMVALGLLAILLIYRIARGAAQWEELNASPGSDRYGTGL